MLKKVLKGFTLVELIIVIAVIAILAAGIFVAIDPARRINQANNARRSTDASSILKALKTYEADNKGTDLASVAALVAGNYYVIGTDAVGCNLTCTAKATQAACVSLAALPGNYLGSIPMDPKSGTAANTDYYMSKAATGNLVVGACDPEGEAAGGAAPAPTVEVSQ